MPRILACAVAASLLLLSPDVGAQTSGYLSASATCDGGQNRFRWSYYDNPENPTQHPEWVGYDVLRRSLADCGEFVRVNAEPFPRLPGVLHGHTFAEVPPVANVTYHYRVILVDANRNEVSLGSDCDCGGNEGWAGCPETPLTHGTLEDWGWALNVLPCPDGCYWYFYIDGYQALFEELRPYAGTGTTIRFYGEEMCGDTEGCSMQVSRYEIADCGPVQVEESTWGRAKVIWR